MPLTEEEIEARSRYREAQDFIDTLTGGVVRKGSKRLYRGKQGAKKEVFYTAAKVQAMLEQRKAAEAILNKQIA